VLSTSTKHLFGGSSHGASSSERLQRTTPSPGGRVCDGSGRQKNYGVPPNQNSATQGS
jgi:hypothetical protein